MKKDNRSSDEIAHDASMREKFSVLAGSDPVVPASKPVSFRVVIEDALMLIGAITVIGFIGSAGFGLLIP